MKRTLCFAHGKRGQVTYRINTAGTEQDQTRFILAAVIQNVQGAQQIMFSKLTGAGAAVHAGKNAGMRCRVDDPITRAHRFQVAGHSDVAVNETNSQTCQFGAIHLRARPQKVIDAGDL